MSSKGVGPLKPPPAGGACFTGDSSLEAISHEAGASKNVSNQVMGNDGDHNEDDIATELCHDVVLPWFVSQNQAVYEHCGEHGGGDPLEKSTEESTRLTPSKYLYVSIDL